MTEMQTERFDAWLDFLAAYNRAKQATDNYNTFRIGIEGMV